MSEPLPFVAFAAPDGSGWGLALGSERAFGPGLTLEVNADVEALMSATGVMSAGTVDGVPALSGIVPELERGGSLRLAVALFDHGRILGLSAVRPRRARGHDHDEYEAVVQEQGTSRPVDDPRLSITLDAAGHPRRVGLELWLAPAAEEGYDVPRRAAGEVDSSAFQLELGELSAAAHRVRWRSRGEDGCGWFLVVQDR